MSITLDHMVLASSDQEAAADRFASIMDLKVGEREGVDGKFVSVRVNDTLRLFFVASDNIMSQHVAFVVDDSSLFRILDRLRQRGMPFGSRPHEPENGRTDHPLAPRGLFWADPDGHLFEVMTSGARSEVL